MKKLAALLALFIITIAFWLKSGFWKFEKSTFLEEKTLELSIPLDVRIDTEFLTKLTPANE